MSLSTRLTWNVAGIFGVILIWQLSLIIGLVPEAFVPSPWAVLVSFIGLFGQAQFLASVQSTFTAWGISVLLVLVTAVPLGVLIGRVDFLRKSTITLIETLRPIPSVAILPLAILVLGLSTQMKISLGVYGAFWPLIITTIYGVAAIDAILINSGRLMGWGHVRVLRKVVLPAALPYVATGLRVATAVALIMVLTAELLGGTSGIGYQIALYQTAGRVADVFAGVLFIGGSGMIAYMLLIQAEKHLIPWGSARGDR